MMDRFTGQMLKLDEALAMSIAPGSIIPLLSRAMSRKLNVGFLYDQKEREVEVHAIGQSTKDGSWVVRGYQVGAEPGWRLFTVDKIVGLQLTFNESNAPRTGYSMDDKQMSSVLSQLVA